MYVHLSKLLPPLILPVGIVLLSAVLALIFQLRGKRQLSIALSCFAILNLWAFSTPLVGAGLYGILERQYPPVILADVPRSDCLVVLGGALGTTLSPRIEVELSEAVDRVYKAAQLYREGKARQIIVSAGNQPWTSHAPIEADLVRSLLMEWGVPGDVIFTDRLSRNTRENAVNSIGIMEDLNCKSTLLVTSAAHMSRAKSAFTVLGVDVFPVSTDVQVLETAGFWVTDLIPNANALAMSSNAMREWMGQKIYRWRGWN